jgi:hypothetical protein
VSTDLAAGDVGTAGADIKLRVDGLAGLAREI